MSHQHTWNVASACSLRGNRMMPQGLVGWVFKWYHSEDQLPHQQQGWSHPGPASSQWICCEYVMYVGVAHMGIREHCHIVWGNVSHPHKSGDLSMHGRGCFVKNGHTWVCLLLWYWQGQHQRTCQGLCLVIVKFNIPHSFQIQSRNWIVGVCCIVQ